MTTLMIEELEVFQQEIDQPVDFGEALQQAVTSVGDKFGLYELMLHRSLLPAWPPKPAFRSGSLGCG